jgi:hypothetical protein
MMLNQDNRLALFSLLVEFECMKTQKLIRTNSVRRLLLVIPVICSLAFAACSDVGGGQGTHATVNLQRASVGKRQTADYVTIGPRTYNSESKSFERPWPFGPEFNPQ